jgi:thioester reductase-like protein
MENLELAVKLTPAQEALWLLWRLEPDNPTYHIGAAARVKGNLDLKRLKHIWQAVTMRHEALSRRFVLVNDRPVQVFSEAHSEGFQIRSEPPDSLEQVLQEPFDLERGPLARFVIWREGNDWVMLCAMHHIAGDAWSAGLIAKEIEQLYAGETLPAAKSFLEFVNSGQTVLSPRPLNGKPERVGTLRQLEIPEPLLVQLKAFARNHSVTIASVLQAAYRVWLWRLTGASDALAIPTLGRSRGQLKTVGLFTQLKMIDIPLEPQLRFLEVLKTTHDATWASLRQPSGTVGSYRFIFNHLARSLDFKLPGLNVTPLELRQQETQAELVLTVLENKNGIKLNFTTASARHQMLEVWADCYLELLEAAMLQPETPISKLELLPESQVNQIQSWASGGEPYPTNQNVIALFEARVELQPEALALIGNENLTYRQLNARANIVTRELIEAGLQHADLVGLRIPRSVESIIAMLGVLKAGGVYWNIPASEFKNDLPSRLLETSDILKLELADNPILEFKPSAAYSIRTSGTTGTPKTIRVSHKALTNYALHALNSFALQANDRVLQFANLSFDAHVEEIFPTLTAGATLILRDNALEARAFFTQLERQKITVISLPTAYFASLFSQARALGLEAPASLRLCVVGGEMLKPQSLQDWQQLAPNTVFVNTYGPTEATVAVTTSHNCTLGKPVPGAKLEVRDEYDNLVPVGVVGQLEISGIVLAEGIGSPYKTGDLAGWNLKGELEFMGRSDSQIKCSGFRVDTLEVAKVLERAGASAVQVQLDVNGWLCAYLVGFLEPAKIRSALLELPVYARPKRFAFLDALPLTSRGKTDHRKLLEMTTQAIETASRAPVLEIEFEVIGLFREVLNLPEVGMESDFFDLGGDSLRALELTLKLERCWNLEIGLSTIYQHRTPQALLDWKNVPRLEPWRDDLKLLNGAQFSGAAPKAERLLLTGSTGFFGVYVLAELLKQTKAQIVCLVRARTHLEASEKLWQNAKTYNLELDPSRIEIALGSLERLPEFGGLDGIFHVAANTDLRLDYASLRDSNVIGTFNILKLGVPTHLVSSISVFGDQRKISNSSNLEQETVPGFGYAQSKWVSDALAQRARSAGLPTWVYRIGRLWGDSRGGITPSTDALWQFLKGQSTSSLAALSDQEFDVMPVDWAAKALVKLAFNISPQNLVLRHPKPVSQRNLDLDLQQSCPLNIAGIQLEPFASNQSLLDLYLPKLLKIYSRQLEHIEGTAFDRRSGVD